jgi:hypothetical protein
MESEFDLALGVRRFFRSDIIMSPQPSFFKRNISVFVAWWRRANLGNVHFERFGG